MLNHKPSRQISVDDEHCLQGGKDPYNTVSVSVISCKSNSSHYEVYTSVYGSVYVNVYVHVFSENVILVDLTCLYVMGSET